MMSIKRTVASAAVVGLAVFIIAAPASATNPGTVPGDNTNTCQADWSASSVLDTDLAQDDPNYPGLMQDLDGNPVAYSNGGYIEAVEPALNNPGYLEVNHFYSPNYETQVWRIPTATDFPMKNVSVTFELGEGYGDPSDYVVTFDSVSTNERMPLWGGHYADYSWTAQSADAATQNADGTWTLDLGNFNAFGGTVYQFNVKNADGSAFIHTDQFVANATLTGEYFPGAGCDVPTVPNPAPTPELGVCQVEYLGTTLWTRTDRDITDRVKVHDGEFSDAVGEVNADGWGAGTDSWGEGSTRTFRLYGGSHTELINVQYDVHALQGFNFNPTTVSGVSTPGGGALQGNGLVEAIEDVGHIEILDEQTVSMEIGRMPAHSSFSFNVTGVLDDTTDAMVLHHRLVGDDPNCDPTPPTEEPTDPEEPTEEPTVPEEPTEEPTDPEEPTEEPTDPEEPTEEPTVPEEPTEEPTVPEEPTEEPTEPTSPPTVTEEPTAPPVAGESLPSTGIALSSVVITGTLLLAVGAILAYRRHRNITA